VSHRSRRAHWLAEGLLSALLAALLLGARDLPLVDLPQHAWQLASWLRIDAHDPSTRDLALNFRTPYLLAYPIARALAEVVTVITALKLTFALSISLQAVTLRKLCERLGHDPWLGLLGFPLGMGYSFCFGFVAFCAALPLVNLAFACSAGQRSAPSLRCGLALSLTLATLLVAHGVALGFLLAVLSPVLLSGGGRLWQRVWPLAAPPLLGLLWLVPGGSSTRLGGDLWQLEPERLLELPGQLVGIGAADAVSSGLGVLLLLALAARLGRPRSLLLLCPLFGTLLGYALFPTMFRGAGPLHPRFTSLLVPALLFGFQPRPSSLGAVRLGRGLVALVTLAVPLVFALRLPDFNRELANFRQLSARLPPGLSLRPIVFERVARAFPGIPALLHVPAYYAVEKQGNAGYSFAMYSISVVRFRPGVRVKMGGGSEWAPERFDATREADDYDYFIVKSSQDRSALLFPGPLPRAVLDAHVGDWWGYRRQK
jgi:hypothetical protein